jgi:hypothetical protein
MFAVIIERTYIKCVKTVTRFNPGQYGRILFTTIAFIRIKVEVA